EGARVSRLAEDEPLLREAGVEDAEVLGILPDEEDDPERGREREEERGLLPVAARRGVEGGDDGHARRDQHRGERRAEQHAEARLAGLVPGHALAAEDAVRE